MLILFILLEPYIFKIIYIGNAFYIDDKYSYVSIAINDAQILTTCYIIYKVAEFSNKYLFYILRSFALFIYIFYLFDIILIIFFSTRLYVNDIFNMYDDVFLFLGNIGLTEFAVIVFFMLCTVMFFQKPHTRKKSTLHKKLLLTVLASTFCVGFFYEPNKSIRTIFFRNYVDVNFKSTYSKTYSEQFVSAFTYTPESSCSKIESRRPDSVYIFLVESWSNYHSKFFGSQNDWTPYLDHLAKNNISLNQFYANGFTTEAGLYALLTGHFPILYGQKMNLDAAVGLMHFPTSDTLPAEMARLGYHPYFITSGDLNFLDKKQWLERIGFSSIIGAADYPESSQRYLFNSVADGELFNKVEYVVQSDSRSKFIVVENVSTHAPFYSPGVKGERILSENAAFLYTDKLLAKLISSIKSENSLIIVMSDHRAMTAMTELEKESSGMMSVSRVPAFIIRNQKNLRLDKKFQQTDLMGSIIGLIEGRQCAGDVKGALFPIELAISPKCIFHARGDSRELITTKCGENLQEFNIVLDGDKTRSQMETTESKLAVDIVNYTRIRQH